MTELETAAARILLLWDAELVEAAEYHGTEIIEAMNDLRKALNTESTCR